MLASENMELWESSESEGAVIIRNWRETAGIALSRRRGVCAGGWGGMTMAHIANVVCGRILRRWVGRRRENKGRGAYNPREMDSILFARWRPLRSMRGSAKARLPEGRRGKGGGRGGGENIGLKNRKSTGHKSTRLPDGRGRGAYLGGGEGIGMTKFRGSLSFFPDIRGGKYKSTCSLHSRFVS